MITYLCCKLERFRKAFSVEINDSDIATIQSNLYDDFKQFYPLKILCMGVIYGETDVMAAFAGWVIPDRIFAKLAQNYPDNECLEILERMMG